MGCRWRRWPGKTNHRRAPENQRRLEWNGFCGRARHAAILSRPCITRPRCPVASRLFFHRRCTTRFIKMVNLTRHLRLPKSFTPDKLRLRLRHAEPLGPRGDMAFVRPGDRDECPHFHDGPAAARNPPSQSSGSMIPRTGPVATQFRQVRSFDLAFPMLCCWRIACRPKPPFGDFGPELPDPGLGHGRIRNRHEESWLPRRLSPRRLLGCASGVIMPSGWSAGVRADRSSEA